MKPKKRKSLKDRCYEWYLKSALVYWNSYIEIAWLAGYRAAKREGRKKG